MNLWPKSKCIIHILILMPRKHSTHSTMISWYLVKWNIISMCKLCILVSYPRWTVIQWYEEKNTKTSCSEKLNWVELKLCALQLLNCWVCTTESSFHCEFNFYWITSTTAVQCTRPCESIFYFVYIEENWRFICRFASLGGCVCVCITFNMININQVIWNMSGKFLFRFELISRQIFCCFMYL